MRKGLGQGIGTVLVEGIDCLFHTLVHWPNPWQALRAEMPRIDAHTVWGQREATLIRRHGDVVPSMDHSGRSGALSFRSIESNMSVALCVGSSTECLCNSPAWNVELEVRASLGCYSWGGAGRPVLPTGQGSGSPFGDDPDGHNHVQKGMREIVALRHCALKSRDRSRERLPTKCSNIAASVLRWVLLWTHVISTERAVTMTRNSR